MLGGRGGQLVSKARGGVTMRRNTGGDNWITSFFGQKRQIKKELQSILNEVTVVKTACEKSRKTLLGLIQVNGTS